MFRSFLGVGLLASATALPFGQHSSSGESKRSLIGEVDALNVCQYRNITQEGIDGGLFGLPRSSSLQYVNSHNDEMQLTPLVTALELALTSIEVDLWLYEPGKTPIDLTGVLPEQLPTEPTLLVGHMEGDLDCRKTFQSLYLDPLLAILNKFDLPNPQGNGWNGIFTDKGVPGETLTLLLDLKQKGPNIWATLLKELEPLQEKGWLTTFTRNEGATTLEDGTFKLGPITIIGTGETPTEKVIEMSPRFIFKDAPLSYIAEPIGTWTNGMWNGDSTDQSEIYWHPYLSPLASDAVTEALPGFFDFAQGLKDFFSSGDEKQELEDISNTASQQVDAAHSLGIQVRWWGLGEGGDWGFQYKAQQKLGGDWIQADDLEAAVKLEDETKKNLAECPL